ERPHGEVERPHGEVERPHGEVERPHALTSEIPQGAGKIPQACIEDFSYELQQELRTLKKRCRRSQLAILVLKLCSQRPLTRQNLAELPHRDESNLKKLVLKPLLETHKLRYLIPEMVKHPKQAYVTNLSSEELEQER
ncbi:MAG: hypothetical protein ACI4WT_03455, partial [Oligosphaeraceae bacterium]